MKTLCVALVILFAVNIASASWLYDVFEEAKEGVQEGISEAMKDSKVKEEVEKVLGSEKVKDLTNKVKDVMSKAKEHGPSMWKLGLEHIRRAKWDEAGLGEKLKKSLESAFAEPTEETAEEVVPVEVMPAEEVVPVESMTEMNETMEEHRRHHRKHGHHGKHGGHHGHHRHHGGHHRHHGGHHRHHGKHGHHGHHGKGPRGLIKTMLGFHKRLSEEFERENTTKNNPFKFGWEKLVKGIQGRLSSGGWKNVHKHVKDVLNEVKENTANFTERVDVPLHKINWGEARMEKLEQIFSKLASRWGDVVRDALDGVPTPSPAPEPFSEHVETPEELALVKIEKTPVDDKPYIKMMSSSLPEYEYAMKKAGQAEDKMAKFEKEWEARVEKEEAELTKGIKKEHVEDEPEMMEKESYKGFPIHEGVMIPAPIEEQAVELEPTDKDDDIDFEPLLPVKSVEIESPAKPVKDDTISYMGIPAKIFHVGESAENTENALKEEEKKFYKKLAEERKEWLGLKQILLKKLAKMRKHKKPKNWVIG